MSERVPHISGGWADPRVRWGGLLVAGGCLLGGAFAWAPVPVALAVAIGLLSWMSLRRFSWSILLLLTLRPCLDLASQFGIALGPIRLNLPAAAGILIFGLAVFYLVDRRLRGAPLDGGGAPSVAFGVLAFVNLLGILVGGSYGGAGFAAIAARESVRFLSIWGMYFVLVNLLGEGMEERSIYRALYISMIVPVALGIGEFFLYLSTGLYNLQDGAPHGRLTGSFFHATAFGFHLAVVIIITLTLLRSTRRSVPRGVLWVTLVISGWLLVFTFARGAWICLAIGLVVKALLDPRRMLKPVLVFGVAAAILVGPRVVSRFGDINSSISLGRVLQTRGARLNSFEWRIYNWVVLAVKAKDRPWLGYGTGATSEVNPHVTSEREGRGFNAHSEWVAYLVEHGIVGVLALAFYYGRLARWLTVLRRRLSRLAEKRASGLSPPGDPDLSPDLAGTGLELLAGFLVVGLFAQVPLEHTSTYYFVAGLLAILRAAERAAMRATDAGRS